MEVSYTQRVLNFTPPASNPQEYDTLTMIQHVKRIEKGKHYRMTYSTSPDGFAAPESILETAFNGISTSQYNARASLGTIDPGLTGWNSEEMNHIKRYMLLNPVRAVGTLKDEYPDRMPFFSLCLRGGISKSTAKVLPDMELVAGELTHVVVVSNSSNKKENMFKIWVAHDKGMLPLKSHILVNNKVLEETVVEQVAMTETDTGGVWYPAKAYRTTQLPEQGTVKYEITTHTFIPNVKVDNNTFRITFPDETHIIDKTIGMDYFTWSGENPVFFTDADELLPNAEDESKSKAVSLKPDANVLKHNKETLETDNNASTTDKEHTKGKGKGKKRLCGAFKHINPDKACGPICLWALMQITGEGRPDCNIECLYALIGKKPFKATSLKNLKDAAQKLGFAAEGYKMTIADLEEVDGYAILPVSNWAGTVKDPLHFILVNGFVDDYVIIVNTQTLQSEAISVADLEESWNGYALVITAGKGMDMLPKDSINIHEIPKNSKSKKYDKTKDWLVTTPAVAIVSQGIVKSAWPGKAPELDEVMEKKRNLNRKTEILNVPGIFPHTTCNKGWRKSNSLCMMVSTAKVFNLVVCQICPIF